MAVFTQVSDEAVAGFLKLYGLPEPDMVTGIAEGTENTNFKVLAGGRRFILTLYEARVDVADLPYFLSLMGEVADACLPSARAISMQTGERLGVLAGRPAALIEFLPGRPNMEPTPEDARKAGAFLAQFHGVTKDLSLHRPNDMSLASWRAMIDRAGAEIERFGDGLYTELKETAQLLSDRWPGQGPRGPIHGDLFPDNLLLDHGDVSGVIDFYFACTDFFAYDLSISMNAYTPETGELDLSNAEAMRSGYETIRPLSDEESASLPTLLCGSALRFFLTRATDAIFVQESALYTGKDPLPWLRLMRHHRAAMENAR
ncbi:homoserine kinase [Parvularcula sp. ZS-1/3]|uniref:Homoserine kinase n=1 Tax=Parvularcula mediterranea TaxID=2732508 RepID=A0A7Y3W4G1_9PROT|nr:homoserine kinase [Parvularcula mediterranea]NNU15428.1 homoserine kinase [Parvularcula mediterranea]